MKKVILSLITGFILINTAFSQDTLTLKNHDVLILNILQMDESNIFYYRQNDSTGTIESLNWNKIESIHFYKNDLATIYQDSITEQENTYDFNQNPVGLSLDILPGIGASINFDVSNDVNLSVGTGLLYSKLGSKFYISKKRKKGRTFISTNFYRIFITHKNYLNFNYGIEYRKKNKINFTIEGGVFVSTGIIFPLVSFGIGRRF